uniref:Selenoprotein F n=1 Tax=Branchiostoma floridae TaxID=7739 RepID=C3ZPF4_BRAFL|eukprot:XP_002589640.1 hypothetical protein BRAFLDRAFT_99247 [Branchiostoma floridae]
MSSWYLVCMVLENPIYEDSSPAEAFVAGTSKLTLVTCEYTSEKCQDLGFTTNLLCSSCDELKQFELQSLEDNCRQCCQQDNHSSTQQYVRGADPILKMLDHKDQVVEILSIEKWDTDNVEEFLSEKLQKL